MSEDQPLLFGPFRFEPTTVRLWRGRREIVLRARVHLSQPSLKKMA
jgi:hypothetical protein